MQFVESFQYKNMIFKKIKGYNYYVSNCGLIYSARTFRFMKPQLTRDGHLQIELYDDYGNSKKFFIHRLVYEAFNGPLIDGMVIEHLNSEPIDNYYTNLKQSTQKENIKTAINAGNFGYNNCRRVKVLDTYYDKILEFNSVLELIQYAGISIPNGSLNKLKNHSKFKARYKILDYKY